MKFVKLELTDCINTDTACHVALFTMIRPLADHPCGILDLLVTRQPATAVEVFHHNFCFFSYADGMPTENIWNSTMKYAPQVPRMPIFALKASQGSTKLQRDMSIESRS